MQMMNHQVRPGTRGWIQTTVITGEITVLFARRHEHLKTQTPERTNWSFRTTNEQLTPMT